jgi:hypothetical protein
VFLAAKKHHTNHHKLPRFHHELTTHLPPQNIKKPQNPLQKPIVLSRYFFLLNGEFRLISVVNPPIRKSREAAVLA